MKAPRYAIPFLFLARVPLGTLPAGNAAGRPGGLGLTVVPGAGCMTMDAWMAPR
jgi:hypothetical protein